MTIPDRLREDCDPEPDDRELDRRDAAREPSTFVKPPTFRIDGWECWKDPGGDRQDWLDELAELDPENQISLRRRPPS